MRALYAYGCGYWSPGVASWRDRLDQRRTESLRDPPCEAVNSRLLRGTSVVTRAAIEALTQAAKEGGADLASVATVFGSELGEVQTAVALLAQIRAEGVPSPMRFKNSVHNTASGTASIAWSNTAFSTAISAGGDLVAMSLLEAWAWLDAHGGDVIVSLAEEEIPAPLPTHGSYPSESFAFHLGVDARAGCARLEALRIDPSVPVSRGAHACSPAGQLLDAITRRQRGAVSLSRDESSPWCVDLRFDQG